MKHVKIANVWVDIDKNEHSGEVIFSHLEGDDKKAAIQALKDAKKSPKPAPIEEVK